MGEHLELAGPSKIVQQGVAGAAKKSGAEQCKERNCFGAIAKKHADKARFVEACLDKVGGKAKTHRHVEKVGKNQTDDAESQHKRGGGQIDGGANREPHVEFGQRFGICHGLNESLRHPV